MNPRGNSGGFFGDIRKLMERVRKLERHRHDDIASFVDERGLIPGGGTSIVEEVLFGLASDIGNSPRWAHEDHTHGTPPDPDVCGEELVLSGGRWETSDVLWWQTPDHADLDVAGDIDLRWAGTLMDWTPIIVADLVAKLVTVGNQRSYLLRVNTDGTLFFQWSNDGVGNATQMKTSTVALTAGDGDFLCVRATLDVDDGAGNNQVKFYTKSSTPATAATDLESNSGWTQLGATVTSAGTTSIFNSTAALQVGASQVANNLINGKSAAAIVKNGINGTTVANPNFYQKSAAFADGTGKTWTPTASTGTGPLDITGDIDLRAAAALTDWTPTTPNTLIAKWNSSTNNQSYGLQVMSDGTLNLFWDDDGTGGSNSRSSTVAPTVTDGSILAIRGTLRVNTLSVKFYTKATTPATASADIASDAGWTQLGATVTDIIVVSLFSGAAALTGGAREDTVRPLSGNLYALVVKNGYDGAGSIVTNPDFFNNISPFVDDSGKLWTFVGQSSVPTACLDDIALYDEGTFKGIIKELDFVGGSVSAVASGDRGTITVTLDFGEVGDISASNFGDTALAGATGELADAGHRHAREVNPVTAHEAAGDPHPVYLTAAENIHEVRDEGVDQGDASTFDFVGAGVTASVAGGVATVSIPGGGGTGDLLLAWVGL